MDEIKIENCSIKMEMLKFHRRSIRLKNYDYTIPGFYYITVCTYKKQCILGKIKNEKIHLNIYGKIVEEEWNKTSQIRKNIILDEFVIMPNHFHGILMIFDEGRGTMRRAPTQESFGKPVSGSIPTIVRSFKSAVTRQINLLLSFPIVVWQRGYYEHVIRSENSLKKLRNYIINNPLKWELDKYNPKVPS